MELLHARSPGTDAFFLSLFSDASSRRYLAKLISELLLLNRCCNRVVYFDLTSSLDFFKLGSTIRDSYSKLTVFKNDKDKSEQLLEIFSNLNIIKENDLYSLYDKLKLLYKQISNDSNSGSNLKLIIIEPITHLIKNINEINSLKSIDSNHQNHRDNDNDNDSDSDNDEEFDFNLNLSIKIELDLYIDILKILKKLSKLLNINILLLNNDESNNLYLNNLDNNFIDSKFKLKSKSKTSTHKKQKHQEN
ncbi:uncharacterized protein ASCRUDRAFT_103981 [Ascoidea rubescens DSM 1968]|uniref:Uncharacterized protein n=1 Tax=Ascoidea rubescens DSM 1968 TaxID=1344418 RepID=A0A1D2VRQ0_9ASCO|nr:hypothetical protein ASCRUDRAFT_103981 [Ascoidea rubescens DSM 1968]ODV64258.1 hypothetical protein ASCRUDRAFT_103981 [Ascoidea rubescens DSM 1968]